MRTNENESERIKMNRMRTNENECEPLLNFHAPPATPTLQCAEETLHGRGKEGRGRNEGGTTEGQGRDKGGTREGRGKDEGGTREAQARDGRRMKEVGEIVG